MNKQKEDIKKQRIQKKKLILTGLIFGIILISFLILLKGGFLNMQQLQQVLPSESISGITNYLSYTTNQAPDLTIDREEITDGFQISHDGVECSVVLSRVSNITYKPYREGQEWTNTFDVPENQLSLGNADLNFEEYYNLTCNVEIVKMGDKIKAIGDGFDLLFDFGTLKREYSEPVYNETNNSQLLSYNVKPQAYDLDYTPTQFYVGNYIDENNKTINVYENKTFKIDVSMKDEYKLSLGISEISLGDKIVFDPTYTITNITTDATLINVDCEGGGYFCHLTTNLTESLVLYMPFDVENNTNTVYDWSKENNDGTISGATFNSTGGLNSTGAYQFDGVDDYINVGNDQSLNFTTNNFTISTWIKYENKSSNQAILAKGWAYTSNNPGYMLEIENQRMYFKLGNKSLGNKALNSFSQLDFNKWYHVVAVGIYNGTNWGESTLYVNGIEDVLGTDLDDLSGQISAPQNLEIGKRTAANFNGTIDEVMIFNRSLSETEIGMIYNQTYPKFEKMNTATQVINQTVDAGYNRANISIRHANQNGNYGTNISLSVYDGTAWSDYQNMSDNVNATFTIDTSTDLNMTFLYVSDNKKFWSPILKENVIVDLWNVSEAPPADAEYPVFSNYLDNNGTLVDSGTAWFNVTLLSTNGSVILEFDGTNYTGTNLTATVYNASVSVASAGTYSYYWGAYSNGTNHYYNTSGIKHYQVNESVDDEYPVFSNFWSNNGTLNNSGDGLFNATITLSNGSVGVMFNNVNYSAENLTATIWNSTISISTNNTYTYYWWGYGNGSKANFNISNVIHYMTNITIPPPPVTCGTNYSSLRIKEPSTPYVRLCKGLQFKGGVPIEL